MSWSRKMQPVPQGHLYLNEPTNPAKIRYARCAECRIAKSRCLIEEGKDSCMMCSLTGYECFFVDPSKQAAERKWFIPVQQRISDMEERILDIFPVQFEQGTGEGTTPLNSYGLVLSWTSSPAAEREFEISPGDKLVVEKELTRLEGLLGDQPGYDLGKGRPVSEKSRHVLVNLLAKINSRLARLERIYDDIALQSRTLGTDTGAIRGEQELELVADEPDQNTRQESLQQEHRMGEILVSGTGSDNSQQSFESEEFPGSATITDNIPLGTLSRELLDQYDSLRDPSLLSGLDEFFEGDVETIMAVVRDGAYPQLAIKDGAHNPLPVETFQEVDLSIYDTSEFDAFMDSLE